MSPAVFYGKCLKDGKRLVQQTPGISSFRCAERSSFLLRLCSTLRFSANIMRRLKCRGRLPPPPPPLSCRPWPMEREIGDIHI